MNDTRLHLRRFRRLLAAAFLPPLALALILTTVLVGQVQALLRAFAWVEHTDRVISQAGNCVGLLERIENNRRDYQLTGSRFYLQDTQAALRAYDTGLTALTRLVADNPQQAAQLESLRAVDSLWKSTLPAPHRSRPSATAQRSAAALEGVRRAFHDFFVNEDRLRAERGRLAQQHVRAVCVAGFGIALTFGALLALCTWRLIRALGAHYSGALAALETSQRRYRATFEQAAVGIANISRAGLFLHVNETLCEITNYSRAELEGKSVQDLTPPEDADPGRADQERLFAGEIDRFVVEKRFRRKEGRIAWVKITQSRAYGPEVTPDYAIAIVEEITAQKEMEAAQGLLAAVVAGSSDAIYSMTLDNAVTSWNPAAQRLYGYAPSEILGHSAELLAPPGREDEMAGVLHRLRQGQTVSPFETVRLRKGGIPVDVSLSVSPITDARGQIVGAATIARDIGAEKRRDTELRQIMAGARCILWHAVVREVGTENPVWEAQITDEEAAARFLPVAALPGRTWVNSWYAARLPEDRERMDAYGNACVRANQSYRQEYRCRMQDGTIRWLAEDVHIEPRAPGVWTAVGVCTDVTQDKRAEEELLAGKREIEALNLRLQRAMTETHHRVKNNLQAIAAILEIRQMDAPEGADRSEFQRISGHIRALALLHDLLTQQSKRGGSTEHIAARTLLEQTIGLAVVPESGPHLTHALDDAPVTQHQGTALALILHELIANSKKHGAEAIRIAFTRSGDQAILTVTDDGPGFPPDFDARTAANTGLELVETLARWDLHGVPCYANAPEGGACVKITFPLDPTITMVEPPAFALVS